MSAPADPPDFAAPAAPAAPAPRRRALRWVTVAVLAVFLLVTVVTGAVSLGAYCLTTDGADTRALPAEHRSPEAPSAGRGEAAL